MKTRLEIIIPQSVLRYFYRDDDARMKIEDEIRTKNIAQFPKYFTTTSSAECPSLKIHFKFVRSWNFAKHFDSNTINLMTSDARGAYSFISEIEDDKICNDEFSKEKDSELAFMLMIQPKIQFFLIAIQLAIPGFVDFRSRNILTTAKNPIVQKMLPYIFTSMTSDLSMMYVFNRYDFNWPTLKDLNVKKTWKWVEKKIENNLSTSKVERALFAFTLIHNSDSWKTDLSSQLFYSMMGIEALYCDDPSNIMAQIRQKVKLVLGDHPEYKKRVNKMYDFRSKFIHGSLDLPNLISLNSISKKLDSGPFEVINSSAYLAMAILVSSLQWLIENEKDDISFETVLLKKDD